MVGKRVLIVEDESIPALELQCELEGMGCTVIGIVGSGEKAVEQALETRPDVIIMDIKLKGRIDGIEAAQIIQDKSDIPVVYLSAYSDDDTRQRLSKTRIYWFLTKPYFFNEIKTAIEDASDGGRALTNNPG